MCNLLSQLEVLFVRTRVREKKDGLRRPLNRRTLGIIVGQAQNRFFSILADLGITVEKRKFPWLTSRLPNNRLGPNKILWDIFEYLDGYEEGMGNKKERKLSPDGYIPQLKRLIEFDELQHFTSYRRKTFGFYEPDLRLGFDKAAYEIWCDTYAQKALNKGAVGYRKPKKEFPFEGGRAAQRALFDAFRALSE